MKVVNVKEVKEIRKGDAATKNLRLVKTLCESKNMSVHMAVFPPRNSSTKHVHQNSEEICFVIKGKGEVTSGKESFKFGSNTLIFIPENVPHQYNNPGEEEMVLLVIYSPPAELPK